MKHWDFIICSNFGVKADGEFSEEITVLVVGALSPISKPIRCKHLFRLDSCLGVFPPWVLILSAVPLTVPAHRFALHSNHHVQGACLSAPMTLNFVLPIFPKAQLPKFMFVKDPNAHSCIHCFKYSKMCPKVNSSLFEMHFLKCISEL